MTLISVILPVYGGEKFIQETLDSLSAQIFDDFEVLCVDDCSPDRSGAIIRSHAAHDPRFRYIKTDKNLGIAPKVMNFAAEFATGDYFVYSSQDDLFSRDWLEKMYDRMLATGADAVLPDVEFFDEGGIANRRLLGYQGDHAAVINGREAFLASLDWTISGNALWRMDFLKEIGFYDFGTFADEYTVRCFFLKCETVAFCDAVFFYRQDNPAAITKSPSSKLLDAPYNHFRIWKLIVESGFGPAVHGRFAVEVIRSLVKAQALIIAVPNLKDESYRINNQFDALQTSEFTASLKSADRYRGGRIMKLLYLLAHRSGVWFKILSRMSHFANRHRSYWRRAKDRS